MSLHKKWNFPLRISTVNMTKSADSCGPGHIYWRDPKWKVSFFVQCMSARGLWINGQPTFCDVRVSKPLVLCHLRLSYPAIHKKNENEKKQEYNLWIFQVEHGSTTSLVFLCWNEMNRECRRFFSHTAERLVNRRKRLKSKISA